MTYFGLTLALLGPGVIAFLWRYASGEAPSLSVSASWLGAFVLLVTAVAGIAIFGERLALADLGFARASWSSLPRAIMLTLFFIFIYAPLASWALAEFGLGSYDAGTDALAALPSWYVFLTIVVVASGEEWLYRGYAIERLRALTGSDWLAGTISVLAFGVSHLPLWGVGASLTTVVPGAILAALYIWRRDVAFLILAHVATDLYGLLIASRWLVASSR